MTVLIDGKLEDPLIKDKKVSLLGGVICGQKISMGSVKSEQLRRIGSGLVTNSFGESNLERKGGVRDEDDLLDDKTDGDLRYLKLSTDMNKGGRIWSTDTN
ncbi:hypothetical protein PPACK8108_LOCUS14800 [Phakopsora pachyrhizi]|uniref:Uncharacterized protein n=1 Tax=Phakopsora pachyrhizi TaxID=170000 RepID=A0AAV0B7W5_PHAPC|nr:hypothetical protein PPACK8108_LOCUS14800 [Phakopsora pachyrhizi]